MFSGSENTLGTKWPQEPPKGPPRLPKAQKITRKHRFSSIFVWCSDVICHIILARDSLAAFQSSQDKTKIAIVAPSFHSIRLHISQGETQTRQALVKENATVPPMFRHGGGVGPQGKWILGFDFQAVRAGRAVS